MDKYLELTEYLISSKEALMEAIKDDSHLSASHRDILAYGVDQRFEGLASLSKLREAEEEVGGKLDELDWAFFLNAWVKELGTLNALADEYGTKPFYKGMITAEEARVISRLIHEADKRDRENLSKMVDEAFPGAE